MSPVIRLNLIVELKALTYKWHALRLTFVLFILLIAREQHKKFLRRLLCDGYFSADGSYYLYRQPKIPFAEKPTEGIFCLT